MMMTPMTHLCNEHHEYDTGIFDSLSRALFGSSEAGQTASQMVDGMDMHESMDNMLTVAFLMFLTVLVAFLGAGLIVLVVLMLLHTPQVRDDEEKQIGSARLQTPEQDEDDICDEKL